MGGAAARFTGEVGAQLKELERIWGKQGQTSILPPVLAERGSQRVVPLAAEAMDDGTPGCATIALLAAPNLSYIVTFSDRSSPAHQRSWPVPSAAGVAQVTRCGARKRLLRGLEVQMRSRRGVVETLVLLSTNPPPPAIEVLPGRDPGPTPPSPQVGRRPFLLPARTRLLAKEAQLKLERSRSVTRHSVLSDKSGRGQKVFNVSPGCHRFYLFAPQDRSAPPDLDARLFHVVEGTLLSSDDEQAGQASVLHCSSSSDRVRLDFSGANPSTEVMVLHLEKDIPVGIPIEWGNDARRTFARTLFEATVPSTDAPPVFVQMGVRGETRFPFQFAARSCYLVAVAPIRGEEPRVQLRVVQGATERRSQSLDSMTGAALTFCAPVSGPATLRVTSVGTAVAWVLGVWQYPTVSTVNRGKTL